METEAEAKAIANEMVTKRKIISVIYIVYGIFVRPHSSIESGYWD